MIINHLSSGQYSVNKNVRLKTSILRSDLVMHLLLLKRTIDLLAPDPNENYKAQKNVAFKNNTPFRSCISKINSKLIDNAEDLDRLMPMCNL